MTGSLRIPTVDLPDRPDWTPRLDALVDAHEGDLVGTLLAVDDAFGFLPRNVLARVAARTSTPLVRLYGLASFYRRFRLEPRGRHTVSVCIGTACHVAGAEGIVDALGHRLDVSPGGTSADGAVTLESVACLGCCTLAPVLRFDGSTRGRMSNAEALTTVLELVEAEPEGALGPGRGAGSEEEP